MPGLFIFVVIAGIAIWLWRLLMVKEFALSAAKKHCRDMDVQFLDGSVIACGIKFERGPQGRPRIIQNFQFEFSTSGDRRYQGWTKFSGRAQLSMELQPHTFPEH